MNTQSRRKQPKLKELTIEERIQKAIRSESYNIKKDLMQRMDTEYAGKYSEYFHIVTAYVLLEELGFKNKRINKILSRIGYEVDNLNKKLITLGDIKQVLRENKVNI